MNQQKQELVKQIYTSIKNGNIVRDGRLFTERELCEIFSVKRSVLRDALCALDTLGVIDIRERQGMFIMDKPTRVLSDSLDALAHYSPMLLHDKSIEARLIVEPQCAYIAAQNCTAEQAQVLLREINFVKSLYQHTDRSIRDKAELAYKHNIILHNTIVDMANNVVLSNIYQYLSDVSRNAFYMLGSTPSGFQPYALWPEVLIGEHEDVVRAIVERDPPRAEETMHQHLLNSQKRNSSTMEERYIGPQSDRTFSILCEI